MEPEYKTKLFRKSGLTRKKLIRATDPMAQDGLGPENRRAGGVIHRLRKWITLLNYGN
jgi:hypothetical protein